MQIWTRKVLWNASAFRIFNTGVDNFSGRRKQQIGLNMTQTEKYMK